MPPVSSHRTVRRGRNLTVSPGGFSLVEMVVTILVTAILSVGAITYILDSVSGYTAASNRNSLATTARAAVDRMALELRDALPNSVRATTASGNGDQCLEFIPIRQVTSYTDAPFTGLGGTEIEAVDFNPPLILPSPQNVYASIYPADPTDIYSLSNPGPTAPVDTIEDTGGADGMVTVYLAATHRFERRSPVDRLYIHDQPVSFCLDGGSIYRYREYGYNAAQCTPADCLPGSEPGRSLIASQVDNALLTAFQVSGSTLRRNVLVSFTLNFSAGDDAILLEHEILLRNVP